MGRRTGDGTAACDIGAVERARPDRIFANGFEQTAAVIQGLCSGDISAEDLINHLIATVQTFTGNVPQRDDMTVVVLKIDGV